MKIAITGGSGFVGSSLAKKLSDNGHEILILDRVSPRYLPNGASFRQTDLVNDIPLKEYLNCDAVVHLAGVNIFGRWTAEYKNLILKSRVATARALIDTVKIAGRGPRIFISASAIGYYGEGGEKELEESSPNGHDFLANVCREWETVAKSSEEIGMRWVSVRTGIVLGEGGGMLSKLIPVFKWGLGGRMGDGKQWFSWIYMDDLLNIYEKVILDNRFSGPVNACAPEPVRNKFLAKSLGKALNRPVFIPIPGFLLKIIMGEIGNVVLMSQKAIPKKLMENGFNFLCSNIDDVLKRIIR